MYLLFFEHLCLLCLTYPSLSFLLSVHYSASILILSCSHENRFAENGLCPVLSSVLHIFPCFQTSFILFLLLSVSCLYQSPTQREESLGNTLGRGLSPTYSPTFFAVTRIYLHGLASAYFPTYPPTHHNPQRIPQQLPLNLSTQRIPQHAKWLSWRNTPTISQLITQRITQPLLPNLFPNNLGSNSPTYSPTYFRTYFPTSIFPELFGSNLTPTLYL